MSLITASTAQELRDIGYAGIPTPWAPSPWSILQMQADGYINYPRDPDVVLAESLAMADHYWRLCQEENYKYEQEEKRSIKPASKTIKPRSTFRSNHYLSHKRIARMRPFNPRLTLNGQREKTWQQLNDFQEQLCRERFEMMMKSLVVRVVVFFIFLFAFTYYFY